MTTAREIRIIELPDIEKCLEFSMQNTFSTHPRAQLKCEVGGLDVLRTLKKKELLLHVVNQTTQERIFTGLIENASVKEEALQYYVLTLTLVGVSKLMDVDSKSKSFQNVLSQYADIIKKVSNVYSQVTLDVSIENDSQIGRPLIQYKETDWEFIKRVASRKQEPVFVDETQSKGYVYVGSKQGRDGGNELTETTYSEGSDGRFYSGDGYYQDKNLGEFLYYQVDSLTEYKLGERLLFNNHNVTVYEKRANLIDEELVYTYKLVFESYIKQAPIYQNLFSGASILGDIVDARGETMKLSLHLKDEEPGAEQYYYSWKPEAGNMMYCMPQKGTTVSLYFPGKDEQEAIAINCIWKGKNSGSQEYYNPSTKTFCTEDNKNMIIDSEAIHLFSKAEEIVENQVSIVDGCCMLLSSAKKVEITTSAGIGMDSPYIDLVSANYISCAIGAENEAYKASIDILSATINIAGKDKTIFLMAGTFGEKDFKIIMDVPEITRDYGGLIRNVLIGVAVTAAVVALCVFALPVVLGAAGVAAATIPTITAGAAIGAGAAGLFSTTIQTVDDWKNKEVTSGLNTLINVGGDAIIGAIEGGVTAPFVGVSAWTEGGKLAGRNMAKRVAIDQGTNALNFTWSQIKKASAAAGTWDPTKWSAPDWERIGIEYAWSAGFSFVTSDVIKNSPLAKKWKGAASEKIMNRLPQGLKDKIAGSKKSSLAKKLGLDEDVDYSDIKTYKESVQKAERSIEQNQQGIDTLNSQLNSLNQKVDVLGQQVENISKKKAAAEARKDVIEDSLANGKGNVRKLKDELRRINTKLKKQTKTISNLEKEIAQKQAKMTYKETIIQQNEEAIKQISSDGSKRFWATIVIGTKEKYKSKVIKKNTSTRLQNHIKEIVTEEVFHYDLSN